MKKPNFIYFLLAAFALLSTTAWGQSASQQQKEQEHKRVVSILEQLKAEADAQPSPLTEEERAELARLKAEMNERIGKTNAMKDRKSFIMNGNKITASLYNYGGIGTGYGLIRHVSNVVWKNMGYVFQFCPFVGAKVVDKNGEVQTIVSDALNDYNGLFEVNPENPNDLWQWQPLEGYADPDQDKMASNPAEDKDEDGKPDSWPREWYNPVLGEYVWPGYLSQNASNADLETYWAMDDSYNKEYEYYPYANDTTKRGIGVQIDGRAFQWSNALAENAIFFVYTITNVSDYDLDTVVFGIYGDPDVGGGSPENTDDKGYFIPPYNYDGNHPVDNIPVYSRNMVYFYDQDMKGDRGLPLGYLGCKFLESPGQPDDGIDNDGDGMIDERQNDGIDNDGDWNIEIHDVGADGIPETGDEGEGDGFPTAGRIRADGSPDPLYPGEPNFEYTDLDESDQIGLTSFNSWTWRDGGSVADDENMWNRTTPQNFATVPNYTDIVFIFGSGYISLKKGESKRISMALLLGDNLADLKLSAETVQRIYNENYQFFRPPVTPQVKAIPGDKKVTLYWDDASEKSFDPITGNDFEGYVIYRSTTPDFADVQEITDGRGTSFLSSPLKKLDGSDARWDVATVSEPYTDVNRNGRYDSDPPEPYEDLNLDGKYSGTYEDSWRGYHPVAYQGRGIHYYLGDNTGLVHSFTDSNNVINGQTYYYAVVAYDHGDSVGIPPTETTKKIQQDPITGNLIFDDNTVAVVPGPRAGGYVAPVISKNENVTHTAGIGTGNIAFEIINDLDVKEGGEYQIQFYDSLDAGKFNVKTTNYSVLDNELYSETVAMYDTNFAELSHRNISDDGYFEVKGPDGTVYTENEDYIMKYERGSIRRTGLSKIDPRGTLEVTYRYYPVANSASTNSEDNNPVFDGIKLLVEDVKDLGVDSVNTGWIEGKSNLDHQITKSTQLRYQEKYPADYKVEFSASNIDTAINMTGQKIPVNYKVTYKDVNTDLFMPAITFLQENKNTRNDKWDVGEFIHIFKPGSKGVATDTMTWVIVFGPDTLMPPTDGDVFLFSTARPFTGDDSFLLKTEAGKIESEKAKNGLDNIYVVPNPYVSYSSLEPENRLPGSNRGERRIYFENLPSRCTIRIFTLSGELVNTLEHDSGRDNGREYWNLLNKDGFSIAYGVYFAHIDAPGVGEKIVKFAIIK